MTAINIELQYLAESQPSLCIPRVFNNITEARIRQVLFELELGKISRIDIKERQNEKGESFKRVYIHFEKWAWNENAQAARRKLVSGKEIKIVYDNPWFWKVSASKWTGPQHDRAPSAHQRPKAHIDFDEEPHKVVDEFGRDLRLKNAVVAPSTRDNQRIQVEPTLPDNNRRQPDARDNRRQPDARDNRRYPDARDNRRYPDARDNRRQPDARDNRRQPDARDNRRPAPTPTLTLKSDRPKSPVPVPQEALETVGKPKEEDLFAKSSAIDYGEVTIPILRKKPKPVTKQNLVKAVVEVECGEITGAEMSEEDKNDCKLLYSDLV